MGSHPKFEVPSNWVDFCDPKNKDFADRWSAVSVAHIKSRKELEYFALKLGRRFNEDTSSEEHWNYRDLEISNEDREKLISLYLTTQAFEMVRNDILNNKVIPSEKYANYTKSQRYDNIWRAIFLVLAVIAVLKILLIK